MYSFEFDKSIPFTLLKEINSIEFSEGVFIWIWHANKIPPHIGVSIDGKYFSLKVKGKDEQLPVNKIKDIITKKSIGTFIIQTDFNSNLKNVASVFKRFTKAESLKTTCLNPIQEIYGLKGKKMILAELLNNFQTKGIITKVFSINLDAECRGIPKYGKKEIEARLIHLENAKRSKSILKGT